MKVKLLWLQPSAPAVSLVGGVSAGGPTKDAAAAFRSLGLLLGCSSKPAVVLSVVVRRSMARGLCNIMQQQGFDINDHGCRGNSRSSGACGCHLKQVGSSKAAL